MSLELGSDYYVGVYKETDHAWAAGILDGEGYIGIQARSYLGGYYSLGVIVGQSGTEMPEMLARLQQMYGGKISGPKPHTMPGRLPRYSWSIWTAQAEKFLRLVAPYVVHKRAKVALALQYREEAVGYGKAHRAAEFAERMLQLKVV